jgi:hypothetical protein
MAEGLLAMQSKSEFTINKTNLVSRRITFSWILLFAFSGIVELLIIFNELEWKWLEAIGLGFRIIALSLIVFSWIMPGVLILLGAPWLAHAWLRGINPIGISSSPWEKMPFGGKVSIYLLSIIISGAMMLYLLFLLFGNRNI